MIYRAIKLRYRITEFCSTYRAEVEEDWLTDKEWASLGKIMKILRPFWNATKDLEGNAERGHHGSLWEALPTMEALLTKLESAKVMYPMEQEPFLCQSINNAWDKLEHYYSLMDSSPAYAAALMLHPSQRLGYFKAAWKTKDLKKHILSTEKKLRGIFIKDYKAPNAPLLTDDPPPAKKRRLHTLDDDSDDDFVGDHLRSLAPKQLGDEYEKYNAPGQAGPLIDDVTVYQWWAGQEGTMPRMAQWAYDTLSIPAMSSECERLFSGAKLTITAQRKSLLPNIIEAVEMMNSWYKRGLVRLPGATNDDIGDAMEDTPTEYR